MVPSVMGSVFVLLYKFSPNQYFSRFHKFYAIMERFNDDKTHRIYFVFLSISLSKCIRQCSTTVKTLLPRKLFAGLAYTRPLL